MDSTSSGSVTLKTVAAAAGVHVSTVSRALRRVALDPAGASAGDLRLFELARDMDYVPNPNAASLTTKKSTAFGVLVPRLTDVVLSAMYDAIEETANRAGYETFVANTHDDPIQQRRRIDLLLGRNVDGLIFGDARLDSENLENLQRRGIKFVLISRRYPGMTSVTCDDHRGGYLAGEHLAGLGHTRVGIVSGPAWASTGIDRLEGCRAASVMQASTFRTSMSEKKGSIPTPEGAGRAPCCRCRSPDGHLRHQRLQCHRGARRAARIGAAARTRRRRRRLQRHLDLQRADRSPDHDPQPTPRNRHARSRDAAGGHPWTSGVLDGVDTDPRRARLDGSRTESSLTRLEDDRGSTRRYVTEAEPSPVLAR